LPLLRTGSINPTKGQKNLENEADIEGKGTHGLRDLRRLGGVVGSDRARGPLVRNAKQTAQAKPGDSSRLRPVSRQLLRAGRLDARGLKAA
jgi:hypothetical protein